MILGSVLGCVRSLMLVQKSRPRISEFWPEFTYLLEQQIKFFLTLEKDMRNILNTADYFFCVQKHLLYFSKKNW